jgi:hypothetical protein
MDVASAVGIEREERLRSGRTCVFHRDSRPSLRTSISLDAPDFEDRGSTPL